MVEAHSLYKSKGAGYFSNARDDIVTMLQTGPSASILEVGCGTGATGAAALAAGKAGRYVGIELMPDAAAQASTVLSETVIGNVESMDLARHHDQYDALIISEVLEHLTDPWACLIRLSRCLRQGGEVIASSPNVSHHTVIRKLLRGSFDYSEAGFMDRTHLRWFTPKSFQEMFEAAGFEVVHSGSIRQSRPLPRMFHRMTSGRFQHLSTAQILIRAVKI
jgi:2-polyprenyl-3-methyl-5-hydroxy-6-metoxy-1,4-benzoquinol methylase